MRSLIDLCNHDWLDTLNIFASVHLSKDGKPFYPTPFNAYMNPLREAIQQFEGYMPTLLLMDWVHSLGVLLDRPLSVEVHISAMAKSAFYQLLPAVLLLG